MKFSARVIFFVFFLVILGIKPCSAQYGQIDSTEKIIQNLKDDTLSVQNLLLLASDCYQSEPLMAIGYCERAKIIAEKINYTRGISDCYGWLGYLYYNQGDVIKALDYEYRGLKIRLEIEDHEGTATSYNNIGYIYQEQNDEEKALEHYLLSLKIRIKIDNKFGQAESYNNIGALYVNQNNPEKALEYYLLSLHLQEELNDPHGIAISLTNIGNLYFRFGDLDCKSEDSLECANSGKVKALEYFNRSLELEDQIGDKNTISSILRYIGGIYLAQKNLTQAQTYATRSMEIAEDIGFPAAIRGTADLLYRIYKEQGKGMEALEMYELYIVMRDSMINETNQKAALQTQLEYEYSTKVAADSIKVVEEKKVNDAKFREEKTKRYALYGGLLLVLIFAGFMFNRFKISKNQNAVIAHQKKIVEEKQKEIIDSIMYAKRLQKAIVPSRESLIENLKDGFVLLKPKDVVSGDFYWLEKYEDTVFFAVADCTGHGVPGALVSIVCSNALSKALLEDGNIQTGQLLDRTRDLVTEVFAKSGEEVNDGMDISLCALRFASADNLTPTLQWSGANNPLWHVRDGILTEYKADKQPIGKYSKAKPFTTHQIELQKSDSIYILTDGYQDQFGGQKGKKISATTLKNLLVTIQDKNMNVQREIIYQTFETWRGNLEQVDDVCIIGVRI